MHLPAENEPLGGRARPSATDWLVGGGEMGEFIRSRDWSRTPLGPVEYWPQSLRSAVSILLPSRAQICLFWGPELVAIYNDAYRPALGVKHPRALGQPAREVWSELWDDVLRPLLERVLDSGEAFRASDHPFALERHGSPEETYFDISYDPVRNETGRVGGVFCIVSETTGRVLGERRLRVLRDLGRVASEAASVEEVFRQAAAVLDGSPHDVAFAGLFDKEGREVASCRLHAVEGWPFGEALAKGELLLAGDDLRPFSPLSGGAWAEPSTTALVLPMAVPGQAPYGFLVAGASPKLVLDDAYCDYLRLVASGIASAAGRARALAGERARAEARAWVRSGTEALEPASPRAGSSPPGARVLGVDDNADVRGYIARLLRREQAANREAELQREHLVEIFTQAPNPILILRGPEYMIELANPPTCRIWGRREEDVVGRPLFDALPELRGQAVADLLDGVMRTGTPCEGKELAARLDRTGDGTLKTVYFNLVYTPLRGIDGAIEGVLVTAFDVTDEVLSRREMSRLRSEAEAASRTKDEFLAMLSHELRNPLAPIVTALSLMRLKGQSSPEIDILERQAGHLTRLVDDLLDVSRMTRGKIELRKRRMELSEAVDKTLEIASPLLEQRRQEVDTRAVARDGLAVDADPDRLAQILSNLLTNAAKYSEPGSRIVLRTGRLEDRVRLTVKDEGLGIAPHMVERVFERFVQHPQKIERSDGGLGLGLAIVRHLTELHGGKVWASSEGPGRGSEFTVELPAASAVPTADEVSAPAAVPEVRAVAKRILVVDDNRDAAETLGQVLRHMGHDVVIAHDGDSCLALARELRPDVAFVDIGLPGVDGYGVAQQLRRQQDSDVRMKLVAITGYGQEADRQRSAGAGFDHHLVKPVDLTELGLLVAES